MSKYNDLYVSGGFVQMVPQPSTDSAEASHNC